MERFDKGSEQWQFMTDFWSYRKNYGNADVTNTEEWFDKMIDAGHQLLHEYKGTVIEQFAGEMILAHWNDVERRYKAAVIKGE